MRGKRFLKFIFHCTGELILILYLFRPVINFAPDFIVLMLVSSLKERMNEDLLMVATIYLSEVVHVQLSDKRTPIRMPKIFKKKMLDKKVFRNNNLGSILAEVYNLWMFLHINTITFIISSSLWMKSGTRLELYYIYKYIYLLHSFYLIRLLQSEN